MLYVVHSAINGGACSLRCSSLRTVAAALSCDFGIAAHRSHGFDTGVTVAGGGVFPLDHQKGHTAAHRLSRRVLLITAECESLCGPLTFDLQIHLLSRRTRQLRLTTNPLRTSISIPPPKTAQFLFMRINTGQQISQLLTAGMLFSIRLRSTRKKALIR